MYITKLDHLVLTVKDIYATTMFYTTVLGMKKVNFGGNRKALQFGSQKINLHQHGDEIEPHASQPAPGSADLCFITDIPLKQVISHIQSCGVTILAGPLPRSGATGRLLSVYLRDPDGNLIEISNNTNE
jgi:catechol 2,3-dioxygenase-like lactoylglutathione lyase family enzyme